jgi:YfiR/HmsC-like
MRVLILTLLLYFLAAGTGFAVNLIVTDKKERIATVKSAMIYQLLNYLDYNGTRLSSRTQKICIVGDTLLFAQLQEQLRKPTHKILNINVKDASSIAACNVIYFSSSVTSDQVDRLLQNRSPLPLILGNDVRRVVNYEMVSFLEIGGKIQLSINLRNLEKSDLIASPDLLDVAWKVKR